MKLSSMSLVLASLACIGLGVVTGCGDDSSVTDKAKEAGNQVENVGDDMKDNLEKASDSIKEGAEKLGDQVKDASEKAGDKLQKAGDDLKDSLTPASNNGG